MNLCTVINVFDRSSETVYIGRVREFGPHKKLTIRHMLNTDYPLTGWLGNPFAAPEYSRKTGLAKFHEAFFNKIDSDTEFRAHVINTCRGRKLRCFCHPLPCHGDIIAEFVNNASPDKECWQSGQSDATAEGK